MKLLVIEDERESAAFVRRGLVENGFVVDVAATGRDGLHLAMDGSYDLAILDVMLPDLDGWDVLSELRKSGRQVPVLILSAKDGVPDRVKGLDLGADDYLVKPFAFTELLARIRTLLRRRPVALPETLRVADLEIDSARHRAIRGGKRLDLTPKEFALLSLLVRHKGEVLSRTVIAEQVWDMNFDSDTNVIDVHVRRLRSKLDDPFERKLLHTKRGVGYVIHEPDVSPPPPLDESLGNVLSRFLSGIEARLDALGAALRARGRGELGDAERETAERDAHKLVGGLGTFGLHEESRLARRLEAALGAGAASTEWRDAPSTLEELRRRLASRS